MKTQDIRAVSLSSQLEKLMTVEVVLGGHCLSGRFSSNTIISRIRYSSTKYSISNHLLPGKEGTALISCVVAIIA